jgi:hypothetical protein
MDAHDDPPAADEPPPIRGRTDTGGPWSTAWSLVALGLIGLMVLRTCVPAPPGAGPASAPASIAPSSR